jgi:predicted nucleotidyltransferase
MPLPPLDERGDLPPGVHPATLAEILERFGDATPERREVTARLLRIRERVRTMGGVQRFIIFGSYVSDKPAPNDIDIILVMSDTFSVVGLDEESRTLLDHQRAQAEFGASVFWLRPAHLLQGTLDGFIAHWQIKRDRTRRGIVEVVG